MDFGWSASEAVCGLETAASGGASCRAFRRAVGSARVCAHCEQCDYDKKYRCGQHWYHQNCLTSKRLEHLRRQRVVKRVHRTHLESQLRKWAQALREVDSDEEE